MTMPRKSTTSAGFTEVLNESVEQLSGTYIKIHNNFTFVGNVGTKIIVYYVSMLKSIICIIISRSNSTQDAGGDLNRAGVNSGVNYLHCVL